MSSNDSIHRFIFEKAPVRGEIIHLEKSFQTIVSQHNYPEALQRLLGEALCVAGLLSAVIKFNGRLTVQFRGQGKLKFLLAQSNNHYHLRGLAKWEGDLSYEDLLTAFKEGVLIIMLDAGPSKTRYQGVVAWKGNSLAESIEAYFLESEQLATRIWLAVDDKVAAGYMLQIIPSIEKEMTGIEKAIVDPLWARINGLTEAMKPHDMLYLDEKALLKHLYPEEDIRLYPANEVVFRCTCTRKNGKDAISLLGQKEAEEEIKDKQMLVVTCDFCNKEYIYDRIDVAEIFEGKNQPPSDTHLH